MGDSIIQRVAVGDAQAVQESIDYYGSLVWTLARRFCGEYEAARDATCGIFTALWHHAGEFSNEHSELAFVVMIARRQLFERRQRELVDDDRLRLGQAMLKPMVGADGSFELFDEPRSAAGALERLRPEQREVLELALVYGRRYDEIACSMRLPIETVKMHARRGMLALCDELHHEHAPSEPAESAKGVHP